MYLAVKRCFFQSRGQGCNVSESSLFHMLNKLTQKSFAFGCQSFKIMQKFNFSFTEFCKSGIVKKEFRSSHFESLTDSLNRIEVRIVLSFENVFQSIFGYVCFLCQLIYGVSVFRSQAINKFC